MAAVAAWWWKQHSVASALNNNNWMLDITDALTVPVLLQYLDVWQWLQRIQTMQGTPDTFTWRWDLVATLAAPPTRHSVTATSILGAKELWKMLTPRKCHFFM
jgi:hypothetical protein